MYKRQVKSRIFDKFYQVDGSHKAEGNGLGLALVKRIVDLSLIHIFGRVYPRTAEGTVW